MSDRIVVEVEEDLKIRINTEAAIKNVTLKDLLTPILEKHFPKKDKSK